MEDQADRIKEQMPVVESYWLKRKKEREDREKELDALALITLKKACSFYDKNYPKSIHGITYDKPKEKLPKISFTLKRENAIIFRSILEYYKTESIIDDDKNIGMAFWRVNENIPDLSRINKIRKLEEKKQEMEKEIHRLQTMKEDFPKEIEKELPHFICHWCNKEFIGDTARSEILEHVDKCPQKPDGTQMKDLQKEKELEKLFTCQLCGKQFNRGDMIDHASKCIVVKDVPKKEESKEIKSELVKCEICGQDGLKDPTSTSHINGKKHQEALNAAMNIKIKDIM